MSYFEKCCMVTRMIASEPEQMPEVMEMDP